MRAKAMRDGAARHWRAAELDRRIAIGIAALCAVAVLVETVLVLVTPGVFLSSREYGLDLWFVADAMWRTVSGQRPGVDFHTPIGPAYYGVYALLAPFMRFSFHMMPVGDLLVGIVAALLTAGLLRRRLPVEAVALTALLAFLVPVSGRELGTNLVSLWYSFLAPYNRWGWALLIPAAMGLMVPRERGGLVPFAVIGLVGGFLLFLKLSYFAAYLLVALGSLAVTPREWRQRWPALVVPAGVVVVVALLWPAIAAGYLADVRSAAAINPLRFAKLGKELPEAGVAALLALIVMALRGGRLPDWRDAARVLLLIAAGGLALLQNHDPQEVPLYQVALLLAYGLGVRMAREEAPARTAALPALALVAALLAPPLLGDLFSAPYQILGAKWGQIYSFASLHGTPLEQLRLKSGELHQGNDEPPPLVGDAALPRVDCRFPSCSEMVRMADGVAMLRRAGSPKGAILALDFSNPFPAAMGQPSPRGGVIWWDYNRTFTEATAPTPAVLLRDVATVMEPLNSPEAQRVGLIRLYGPTVRQLYEPVAQSPFWRVWRRRSGAETAR